MSLWYSSRYLVPFLPPGKATEKCACRCHCWMSCFLPSKVNLPPSALPKSVSCTARGGKRLASESHSTFPREQCVPDPVAPPHPHPLCASPPLLLSTPGRPGALSAPPPQKGGKPAASRVSFRGLQIKAPICIAGPFEGPPPPTSAQPLSSRPQRRFALNYTCQPFAPAWDGVAWRQITKSIQERRGTELYCCHVDFKKKIKTKRFPSEHLIWPLLLPSSPSGILDHGGAPLVGQKSGRK